MKRVTVTNKKYSRRKEITDTNERKQIFQQIELGLNIKKPEDWRAIKFKDFRTQGGETLLPNRKKTSLTTLLQEFYPTIKWNHYDFEYVPKNYWRDINNQRDYCENVLKPHFNIKTKQDWLSISSSQIKNVKSGATFLMIYKGSYFNALKAIYPEEEWEVSGRRYLPQNYWSKVEHQIEYMEYYYKITNMQSMEDWYNVSLQEFTQYRGGHAILAYHRTLFSALTSLYPTYAWDPLKTSAKKKYIHAINPSSRHSEPYSPKHPARSPSNHPPPHHHHHSDSESRSGSDSGDDRSGSNIRSDDDDYHHNNRREGRNQSRKEREVGYEREYVKEIIRSCRVRREEDFYRISKSQMLNVMRRTFGTAFNYRLQITELLRKVFPDFKWELSRFNSRLKKANQRHLFVSLSSLFPKFLILENFRTTFDFMENNTLISSHSTYSDHHHHHHQQENGKIQFDDDDNRLQIEQRIRESEDHLFNEVMKEKIIEFDVFIPSLQLIFEYQGVQHYDDIPAGFSGVEVYVRRDNRKKLFCQKNKFSLIEIPFWWNLSAESLSSSLPSQFFC